MHSHVTLDTSVKLLLDSITILVTETTVSNDLFTSRRLSHSILCTMASNHQNVVEHLVVETASLEL